MKFLVQDSFWRQALGLHGSISLHVAPRVVVFGLIAAAVCGVAWLMEHWFEAEIGLEVAPFEIAGACLGLLMVLRWLRACSLRFFRTTFFGRSATFSWHLTSWSR